MWGVFGGGDVLTVAFWTGSNNEAWETRLPCVPRVGDDVSIGARLFVVVRVVWRPLESFVTVYCEPKR